MRPRRHCSGRRAEEPSTPVQFPFARRLEVELALHLCRVSSEGDPEERTAASLPSSRRRMATHELEEQIRGAALS